MMMMMMMMIMLMMMLMIMMMMMIGVEYSRLTAVLSGSYESRTIHVGLWDDRKGTPGL